MQKQKVVIVGAGFAGVKAALELMNNDKFEVTLMSPRGRFEYHGAMYRSATGRSPLEVVIALSEIFKDAENVTVVLDSAVELSPGKQRVEGETGREYPYDTLIMAAGYVVNYFGIEGMALHAENMYSISSAIKLRHRLVGAFRAQQAGKPLDIVVIGAGPTGIEIAADIHNFAKIVEGKHGLGDIAVQVHVIEASNRLLPTLSEESSTAALERITSLGVGIHLNTRVTKCNEASIETEVATIPSDITIWTAGNKANPLFASYPDIFKLSKNGRVEVNEFLQSLDQNIYVLGDAAQTEFSGMAQTAIHNAVAVAQNLISAANGEPMKPYEPKRPAYVVPIGGEWALLETEEGIKLGDEGWQARRDADHWVLENFLVYQLADKHYKHGEKIADF